MQNPPITLDCSVWDSPDESVPPPGQTLASLRQALGFTRSALARATNARNISKFCQRLTNIERGNGRPDRDLCHRINRALGLSRGQVASLWAPLDRINAAHRRACSIVHNQELRWLRTHHNHLFEHRHRIIAAPELANARVDVARVTLMWAGGGCFTVGELLQGWQTGRLLHETHGGRLARIVSAHGSALSGLRGVVAVDATADELSNRPSSLAIRSALRDPRPDPSPLSFGDVLAEIGVAVADLIVRGRDGVAIARYRHGHRMLCDMTGRPLFSLNAKLCAHRRPESFFGNGQPLSRGPMGPYRSAWKTDRWVIDDQCVYADGRVLRDGLTVGWVDAVPPPSLLPVLLDVLT